MTENSTDFDVLIIGGGPAGLSTALWCADLGLRAVIFEKEPEFGGQLLWTFNAISNHLGAEACNGRELRDRFLQHIENTGVRRLAGTTVLHSELTSKALTLADGSRFSGRAIVIATGVRRRKLGVPGEEEFAGRGVLESGVKAKSEISGKTVVIVGGGDAALENAIVLSNIVAKVVVVHWKKNFSARKEFIKQAASRQNIEFLFDTSVSAIVGEKGVESVELFESRIRKTIGADNVLIRIGVVPNTGEFAGQIAMDDLGYITVDDQCATSLNDIFSAGDVASRLAPTISNAVGQGSVVAKAILKRMNS